MEKSETIANISKAILKAQKEMGNAIKDSANPFFKSKYADLNSVREACIPALNNNGITALQPIVMINGVDYVETILLHESGEFFSSLTKIIFSKQNDAQSMGSGISYARRYALQSIVNIGADDDDGNKASTPPKQVEVKEPVKATDVAVGKLIDKIKQGEVVDIEAYKKVMSFTENQLSLINQAINGK